MEADKEAFREIFDDFILLPYGNNAVVPSAETIYDQDTMEPLIYCTYIPYSVSGYNMALETAEYYADENGNFDLNNPLVTFAYAFDAQGRLTAYHKLISSKRYHNSETYDCQFDYAPECIGTRFENMPYHSYTITNYGNQYEDFYFSDGFDASKTGAVRSVTEKMWGGNKGVPVSTQTAPDRIDNTAYTYTSSGLISIEALNTSDGLSGGTTQNQYQADANGFVTAVVTNLSSPVTEDLTSARAYAYDSKGFLRQSLTYPADGIRTLLTIYDYGTNNSKLGSF